MSVKPNHEETVVHVEHTHCQRCMAGMMGNPLAKLKEWSVRRNDNILVCDICGSTYALVNGVPQYYHNGIQNYRNPIMERISNYSERNEASLRPVIIPFTWLVAQTIIPDLLDYRFPIVTTPMSLLYTYSMTAISSAVGGRTFIGIPSEIESIFKTECKKLDKEIIANTTQNILFVTDILQDNMITGYNPESITVVCIRDERKNNKRTNVPRVFEITSERIRYS
jgi:hypothetical protein